MATVIPEVVLWEDGRVDSIDYAYLVSLLTKGVQELDSRTGGIGEAVQKQQMQIDAVLNIRLSDMEKVDTLQSEVDLIKSILGLSGGTDESSQSSSSASTSGTGLLTSLQTLYDNFVQLTEALGLKNVDGELVVESSMHVLGDTTLSDVTITGDLTAGMLKFNSLDNSLDIVGPACYNDATGLFNDTVCDAQTLYVQKTLAGRVDFFNGAIVLEPNGNIKVAGDLELAGKIKAGESMRGTIEVTAGQGSMRIEKDWASVPASVVATPKFDARVWVSDVDQTGFTVNVNVDAPAGEIYWIAIW